MNPYPQPDILSNALAISNTVDAKAIVEQGFKDKEIGEQIHNERLTLIQEALDNQ